MLQLIRRLLAIIEFTESFPVDATDIYSSYLPSFVQFNPLKPSGNNLNHLL
jgi:hypothetical protein